MRGCLEQEHSSSFTSKQEDLETVHEQFENREPLKARELG